MMDDYPPELLWWVIPGILGGMPMPYIDPIRRNQGEAGLNRCDDELPLLYAEGIRSVVSLIETPSEASLWQDAGFAYLSSPIPNFAPPETEQMLQIIGFVSSAPRAVAVYCRAGIGRTGTVVAALLIHDGISGNPRLSTPRSL